MPQNEEEKVPTDLDPQREGDPVSYHQHPTTQTSSLENRRVADGSPMEDDLQRPEIRSQITEEVSAEIGVNLQRQEAQPTRAQIRRDRFPPKPLTPEAELAVLRRREKQVLYDQIRE
jgi:hypothetical protein